MFDDGIYFGLDNEAYHADPALNTTGIKLLRISPLEYWMNSPLNPARDEQESAQDSFAKLLGSAYHCRICEGKEAFDARYAPELEKADHKGALVTSDDLSAWLVGKGLKKSGRKQELIDRALEADPTLKIWDVIEDGYRKQHEGKTFLPWRNIQRIETAAAMIERDPQIGKAFSGGAPEVAIFWTCATHGVRMKCKVDYLKSKAIVELKSFGNPQGKPIDRAIASAFASRRYHIAAALYDEGVKVIPGLIREGRVFGDCDKALLNSLKIGADKTYLFVWQHSGAAPIVRGKVLPRESLFFRAGETEVDQAKQLYRKCMENFGADTPWIDSQPIEAMDDATIPAYGLE